MIEPRNAVIQAIMRAGHIPLGMEAFGAANSDSWKVIEKTIDSSDYYVLLIARRYGSIDERTDMGWTEREFRYAVDNGVPCYVFILNDSASWPGNLGEGTEDGRKRLGNFLKYAKSVRQAAFWNGEQDLPLQVMTSLMNAFNNEPRDGWIRAPKISPPGVAEQLARLISERDELKRELEQIRGVSRNSRILTALSNKVFRFEDVEKSASNMFAALAINMAASALEFSSVRKIVAKEFDEEVDFDKFGSLSGSILDFLGSLNLIKSQAIGKTPTTYIPGFAGNGGYSIGGSLQEVYVLTDIGRDLYADLTIERLTPKDDMSLKEISTP